MKKKNIFSKFFDKLDQKMVEKAQEKKCCCCADQEKEKSKKGCSK